AEIAAATGCPPREVAEVYFTMSEHFGADELLSRITGLARGDRWSALARSALRYDLYAALAGLSADVLTSTRGTTGARARIAEWERQNAEGLARARGTLGEILAQETQDLATLSVALRAIRTLLRG
ncbi:MAG: glutamate dehydrogenase, partial [Pseudonocardiales bacterium]|nr:glutamate dehydrogenase [Pseudonocardiales bacterium]